MPDDFATLQDAINEASLLLEAADFITAAEHSDPGRWRAAVAALHGVIARRLAAAVHVVDRMEGAEQ